MYVQLLTFYQYKHYLKHVCCVFVTQLHHGVAVFTGRTYTPHGVWPSRNWCIDTRVAMLVRYFTETWLDNLQHTLCFTDRCGVKIHLLLPTLWDLWCNVFNGSTVAIMCHNNSYYAFDSHFPCAGSPTIAWDQWYSCVTAVRRWWGKQTDVHGSRWLTDVVLVNCSRSPVRLSMLLYCRPSVTSSSVMGFQSVRSYTHLYPLPLVWLWVCAAGVSAQCQSTHWVSSDCQHWQVAAGHESVAQGSQTSRLVQLPPA